MGIYKKVGEKKKKKRYDWSEMGRRKYGKNNRTSFLGRTDNDAIIVFAFILYGLETATEIWCINLNCAKQFRVNVYNFVTIAFFRCFVNSLSLSQKKKYIYGVLFNEQVQFCPSI